MQTIDAAKFLPEKLRDGDLNTKIVGLTNYVIANFQKELEDVVYKNTEPQLLREETIAQIITELGFGYINGIVGTISNFEFNALVEFIGLLNLLKGSKDGLQLVLRLLGLTAIVSEWWEQAPQAEPFTFDLFVLMNNLYVSNAAETLKNVDIFVKHYVFPKLRNIDFRFNLQFAKLNLNHAGFVKAHYTGAISFRI